MPLPEAIAQRIVPADPRRIEKAISRLQALPAFYPAVRHALQVVRDPESSDFQLQRAVCADQAMAARVLKLANSAYFGYHSQVQTVTLALTLIGREKTATLLHRFLADELIGILSGYKPSAAAIRETSQATAAGAYLLAERLLRSDKEEALLAGLLHNIGDLLLLSQFRDDYEEMLRLSRDLQRAEAEKAVFGVEARIAAKWLLEAWNFPPLFPAVAEHFADPWAISFLNVPVAVIVIVHTARQLADSWLARQPVEMVAESVPARLLSTLEVDRAFLADVYSQLPQKMSQLQASQA